MEASFSSPLKFSDRTGTSGNCVDSAFLIKVDIV